MITDLAACEPRSAIFECNYVAYNRQRTTRLYFQLAMKDVFVAFPKQQP